MTKTEFKIRETPKIPLEITVENSTNIFLFPPKRSNNYFKIRQEFQERGWHIPTAHELADLLCSTRMEYSKQGYITKSIVAEMIRDSWDKGLQSCTYLHPTNNGLYILEDPDIDHIPSEDELKERIGKNPVDLVFLEIPNRKNLFGTINNLPIFKMFFGNNLYESNDDFVRVYLDRGFLSFELENFGPTPNHIFTTNSLNRDRSFLYYPIVHKSEEEPKIEFITEKELQRSRKRIGELIQEEKRLKHLSLQGGDSYHPAGYVALSPRKRYGLNPDD